MPDPAPEALSARLRRLREVLVPVLKPYVTRITLFGSAARDDDRPGSDLDVLVTLNRPVNVRPWASAGSSWSRHSASASVGPLSW